MMKSSILIGSLAGMILLTIFSGCEEEPPFIDYNPPKVTYDTSYIDNTSVTPQRKVVLLEDVSGVKCPNCPDATYIAKSTRAELGGRLNFVVIHPNISSLSSFVKPIEASPFLSYHDFRTNAGKSICEQIIGVPNSLPRGCVDRVKFSDMSEILTDRTVWNSKIKARDALTSPVNIELTQIPGLPNQIILEVAVRYTQAQTEDNFLSIMLLEDSITDVQEYQDTTGGGSTVKFNPNYVHNHVLRDMFTLYTGDILNKENVTLVAGRVIKKRYIYNIPAPDMSAKFKFVINRANTRALAFVHNNKTGNREVLQSHEIELD